MPKNVVSIANRTRSTVVCRQAVIADTFTTRLFGLLGRDCLEPGAGLLLQPSTGVHTWGMSFAIDIVTLDCERRVVGVWESVEPWRMRGLDARTRSVLELPAGQIVRAQISLGDELVLTDQLVAQVEVEAGLLAPFLRYAVPAPTGV